MGEEQRAVGDSVESRCTKCRKVTRHIVVSLVGGTPAKVECTLCQGVHNFRPPQTTRPSGASRPAAPRKAAATKGGRNHQREWEEVARSADPSRAVPYAMTTRFAADDWVRHPSFGLGLVKKTIRPNKMEVLFEQGVKVLRCTT